MNTNRLRELQRILQRIDTPDHPFGWPQFDMRSWSECGTVACAFGIAAMHPPFVADGLRLSSADENGMRIPMYDGHEGFKAAEEFFDINYDMATMLFSPETYPGVAYNISPDQVVTRIDQLIGGTL